MTDRKDGLISYHLIGRFHDNSIWIQPLNDQVPQELGFWETLALQRLCNQVGAEPVGTIRCRMEGELTYHYSYFNEPPSPEDEEAKNNALLRIAVGRTGFIEEKDGAERAIEGMQFLERELGFEWGER